MSGLDATGQGWLQIGELALAFPARKGTVILFMLVKEKRPVSHPYRRVERH